MDEHDDEYESEMREELSHVPLGELRAMQEKMGLKAFNKIKTGSKSKSSARATYKRLNKHRPAEFSARRTVPKQMVSVKEKTRRDPRFDDLSGEFSPDVFKNTYGFLDDIKAREKNDLKNMLTKTKDKSKKIQLKNLINRLEQREKAEKKKEKQREMEREWKKKEEEKVLEGKKPYFLKKSEKKARMKEQYKKELEETGQLEKYTERKNKKIAAQEKKRQKWKVDNI